MLIIHPFNVLYLINPLFKRIQCNLRDLAAISCKTNGYIDAPLLAVVLLSLLLTDCGGRDCDADAKILVTMVMTKVMMTMAKVKTTHIRCLGLGLR